MEYRRLGNSGLQVSVVGLGTNNFGGRMDYPSTERVLKQAVHEGINLIDTSNSYGNGVSEEYIGRAVKGERDKVLLATKFASKVGDGPNQRGASRKHIIEQVDISLKKLLTDYIDLYQVHFPDPQTPIEETMRTLDDLVKQGKVRYIGCSNFAAWQVAEAMGVAKALGLEPFISAQPEYSMLKRDPEKELAPCCRKLGLGILPYFPLGGGFLTGKYKRGQPAPAGTRLAGSSPRAQSTLTDANFHVVEGLEAFATKRERQVVHLAIAWLLANPLVGSVISGATKPEQVTANAGAAGWNLASDELDELEKILQNKP